MTTAVFTPLWEIYLIGVAVFFLANLVELAIKRSMTARAALASLGCSLFWPLATLAMLLFWPRRLLR